MMYPLSKKNDASALHLYRLERHLVQTIIVLSTRSTRAKLHTC
jgi:hypothetical protein